MIEVRFDRQRLAIWEKRIYARVLKEIVTKIFLFKKGTRLFKEVADTEIRILFK